jgi:hypothetical protein
MQYARRQRAKGRRPLINSAALPGQKAAHTVLLVPPTERRSTIEITALFGALSNTGKLSQERGKPRTHGQPRDERTRPAIVSAASIGSAAPADFCSTVMALDQG